MPVRRAADPICVQHAWDAVRFANSSHLTSSLPVMVKYLQKVENCTINQAELHVKQCLQDGLLISLQKLGTKGSKIGVPVEVYKIPLEDFEKSHCDDKDWYCIECHLAGDVTPCRRCHRVFHSECITVSKKKFNDFQNISKTCNNYNIKATLENRLSSLNSSTSTVISDVTLNDFIEETNKMPDKDGLQENEKNTDNACSLVGIFESFDKMEDDTLENLVDSPVEEKDKKMNESCPEAVVQSIEDKNEEGTTSDTIEVTNRTNSKGDNGYDESLCRICNLFDAQEDVSLEKKELNYLLMFVLKRIRSWIPACLTDKMAPNEKPNWLTGEEVKWRESRLFYENMDMSTIEKKIESESYSRVCEFMADVVTVQHNVAIFHGIESQEYGAAELMYEDCNYDLSELRNCVDCYRHSNEKINSKWFSLPCRVPHKLVWAKQKGYPYWPAKVIKEANGKYDVRFFGGNHERALLQKIFVKPISTPMKNLQIKKNAAFNRAMDELMLHQRLIENPSEVNLINEKIKTDRRPREKKVLQHVPRPRLQMSKKVENISPSEDDVFTFDEMCDDFENSFAKRIAKRKLSRSPSTGSMRAAQSAKKRALVSSPAVARNLPVKTAKRSTADVINLTSDGDEDVSFKDDDQFSPGYGEVSSSTEHIKLSEEGIKEVGDGIMQQLDRQYSEAVERTKQKLEKCKEKKQLIKVALDNMQAEIDRINNDHDDYLKKIFEAHNQEISQTKKKQWCYNCEQDAIYHCCWNTAYCSPTCQQQHWQAEHKKVCRRKR